MASGSCTRRRRRSPSSFKEEKEEEIYTPLLCSRERLDPSAQAEGPELHKVVRCVPVRTCFSIAPNSLLSSYTLSSLKCCTFLHTSLKVPCVCPVLVWFIFCFVFKFNTCPNLIYILFKRKSRSFRRGKKSFNKEKVLSLPFFLIA